MKKECKNCEAWKELPLNAKGKLNHNGPNRRLGDCEEPRSFHIQTGGTNSCVYFKPKEGN